MAAARGCEQCCAIAFFERVAGFFIVSDHSCGLDRGDLQRFSFGSFCGDGLVWGLYALAGAGLDSGQHCGSKGIDITNGKEMERDGMIRDLKLAFRLSMYGKSAKGMRVFCQIGYVLSGIMIPELMIREKTIWCYLFVYWLATLSASMLGSYNESLYRTNLFCLSPHCKKLHTVLPFCLSMAGPVIGYVYLCMMEWLVLIKVQDGRGGHYLFFYALMVCLMAFGGSGVLRKRWGALILVVALVICPFICTLLSYAGGSTGYFGLTRLTLMLLDYFAYRPNKEVMLWGGGMILGAGILEYVILQWNWKDRESDLLWKSRKA